MKIEQWKQILKIILIKCVLSALIPKKQLHVRRSCLNVTKEKKEKKNEYFKDSQMRKIKHWKFSHFNENNFIGIELLLP